MGSRDYLERRQSENKYTITLPDLRANWVHEETVDIGSFSLEEDYIEISEEVEEDDDN